MQDVLPQHEAMNEVSAIIDTGEKLLWAGKPLGGMRLHSSDWGAIPFSLVWAGFVFFFNYQVWRLPHQGPEAASVRYAGLPILMVGIYVVFGRFFFESFIRRLTTYGITNERVILISKFPTFRVRSLRIDGLNNLTLSQRADGSGDILFDAPETVKKGRFRGARESAQFFGTFPTLGRLIDIANVKEPYDLMHR